ncbi:MAG: hypothetical protein PUB14_05685 [Lachnospiraceae bacterium]|nr:hypothetical protein [Lachnospiraceae bacterium]
MVTVEEMKNAVGHNARITFVNGSEEVTYIEAYQYKEDDDEEPFLEFTTNRVDYQSSIKNIQILD